VISIDPDYSNRDGYREDFLGASLPLPGRQAFGETASAELKYHHFSVVMHRHRRLALFTAVNIDGRSATKPRRDSDRWIIDPRLPREEQTGEDAYRDNPLDPGHLVRRLDPPGPYRTYQVPVRRIAQLTTLDLHPYIAADPLERLEATALPRMILRPEDVFLGT
jgi:DNA/RNA endonuclease G (NUC1)